MSSAWNPACIHPAKRRTAVASDGVLHGARRPSGRLGSTSPGSGRSSPSAMPAAVATPWRFRPRWGKCPEGPKLFETTQSITGATFGNVFFGWCEVSKSMQIGWQHLLGAVWNVSVATLRSLKHRQTDPVRSCRHTWIMRIDSSLSCSYVCDQVHPSSCSSSLLWFKRLWIVTGCNRWRSIRPLAFSLRSRPVHACAHLRAAPAVTLWWMELKGVKHGHNNFAGLEYMCSSKPSTHKA